jgi:hypothetical protein
VIHLIFVPGIMATALVFVNYAPSLETLVLAEPTLPALSRCVATHAERDRVCSHGRCKRPLPTHADSTPHGRAWTGTWR